ncbi:MAG: hypothetical protein K2P81_08980 [Bacteriovoracaceae bacterium]|nr:hypothetical protein [Bacteriovoracaceae bacterium]
MKRWWIFLTLILALGFFFFFQKKPAPANVAEIKPQPLSSQRAPAQVALTDRPSVTKESRRDNFRASTLNIDRQIISPSVNTPGFSQNGRLWRWLDGAVAVDSNDSRVRDIPVISRRAGFVIIASGDLPRGVEGLQLVEREDNKLVGIFTGILKAQGSNQLSQSSQFSSQCPCEIKESYPSIRGYLIKSSEENHEELRTCLQSTGLFKKLEWEILSQARFAQ